MTEKKKKISLINLNYIVNSSGIQTNSLSCENNKIKLKRTVRTGKGALSEKYIRKTKLEAKKNKHPKKKLRKNPVGRRKRSRRMKNNKRKIKNRIMKNKTTIHKRKKSRIKTKRRMTNKLKLQ